jgi:two-component system OmpR family response regulator
MRILLVEDDNFLANGLSLVLKDSGYMVDHAEDGIAADISLSTTHYDLVVLDLCLPGIDGIDVLKKMRGKKNNVPVLILSARDQVKDRVLGLDAGANDYLTKPFDMNELEARVRALIRLGWGNQEIVTIKNLHFNTVKRTAHINDELVTLTKRELAVLEVLVRQRNLLIHKEQLMEQLSSWDKEITNNALDIAVHRLRKKLKKSGISIKTIRNLGYTVT